MARQEYDADTKAAVLAALLEGQAVSHVAAQYKIPEGTVASWKSRLASPTIASEKSREIGVLLVTYLTTNLETLRIQAEAFRDVEWLHQQNAADVAVLHGVLTDKSIRLLEALAPEPDDEPL